MVGVGDEDAHLRCVARTIIHAKHGERTGSGLILTRRIDLPWPTARYASIFGPYGVEEKVHVHFSKPWLEPEGFKVYYVEIILDSDVIDAGLWR